MEALDSSTGQIDDSIDDNGKRNDSEETEESDVIEESDEREE